MANAIKDGVLNTVEETDENAKVTVTDSCEENERRKLQLSDNIVFTVTILSFLPQSVFETQIDNEETKEAIIAIIEEEADVEVLEVYVEMPYVPPEVVCVDRVGKFRMINFKKSKRNFSWLTKNRKRVTIRKENYCSKAQVKTLCQKTCDFCECKDDPNFTFPLFKDFYQPSASHVADCAWLTKNKWRTETRINNYCKWSGKGFQGGAVRDACAKSCGFCKDD